MFDVLSTPFFFFNDTATTEIYTLSLHDALPISLGILGVRQTAAPLNVALQKAGEAAIAGPNNLQLKTVTVGRSEEHTSELQSQSNLVCRLLLEKKTEHESVPNTCDHLVFRLREH